jgi:hypothetical protein
MSPAARVRLDERFVSRELPVRPPRRACACAPSRAQSRSAARLARAAARSLAFRASRHPDGERTAAALQRASPARVARLAALSPRGVPPRHLAALLTAFACGRLPRRLSQRQSESVRRETGGCGVWRREPPRTLPLTLRALRASQVQHAALSASAWGAAAPHARACCPQPERGGLGASPRLQPRGRAPRSLAARARCATAARPGAAAARASCGFSCSSCV